MAARPMAARKAALASARSGQPRARKLVSKATRWPRARARSSASNSRAAAGLAIERERHPRKIDEVVLGQRRGDRVRLRQLEQLPRRRAVAPIVEGPLPIPVGADDMQPRQAARHAHHMVRADALRAPGRQHLLAPGIVAQRGEVVDGNAEAGEIDGGVQRVAAIAARQQPARRLRQLDHALANRSDAGHGLRLRRHPPARCEPTARSSRRCAGAVKRLATLSSRGLPAPGSVLWVRPLASTFAATTLAQTRGLTPLRQQR